MTADDILKQNSQLAAIRDRFDQLGGRLLGVEQLPRNKRPETDKAKVLEDKLEPVLSDSEKVNNALVVQRELITDLEELAGFLEQL